MAENSEKIEVATALRPVLDAFHGVNGQLLTSVSYVRDDRCLVGIVFVFDRGTLTVTAIAADDTVGISATTLSEKPMAADVSDKQPWVALIGEPFGWGWLTINQQGYCDGVLLSFRGIQPQIVLTVEASSLKVGTIARL